MRDPELTMEILLQLLTPSGLGTLAVDTSGQDDAKQPGCPPRDGGRDAAVAGTEWSQGTVEDGEEGDLCPAA